MAEDEKSLKNPRKDEDVIKQLNQRMSAAINFTQANNREALTDLKMLAGEQWDEQAKRLRESENRPALTINKLQTFVHQVTNNQRQNSPGIKVHPVGEGSDKDGAEVRQGLIRHIEYDSNAKTAYATAVNSAAAIGFGYFRLITEYSSQDSFDQCIKFKRIRNPFSVYCDPASVELDGSDATWWAISELVHEDDLRGDYPDLDITDSLKKGIGDSTESWWDTETKMIRVVDYYSIETTKKTLYRLSNGQSVWEGNPILDALPLGTTIKKTRESEERKVILRKMTGAQVLESTEIKSDWIPVFPVYGDELDIEGKVIRSGVVRAARDPQKMYNYWASTATEEYALRPKVPYIGAAGQFEGFEEEWANANNRSYSYLQYTPVVTAGVMAPPPQRQMMVDVPAGAITMLMHANDDIKGTTGLFDSSLGSEGNATSGIQERAQQQQGSLANFHYTDNLNTTMRHVGRTILSMIPHYYDAPRVERILGIDETVESVTLNEPYQRKNKKTGAIETVLHDMTSGKYDCTVGSGPAYTTMRRESAQQMIEAAQTNPKLWDVAGDKIVRSLDWVNGDEIADRLEKALPPGLADAKEGEEQPLPPEVQQQMAQMDQVIQDLQSQLQEAQSGIQKAQIDSETKLQIEQMRAELQLELADRNNDTKKDVEEIKGAIAMLLQHMQPPPQLTEELKEPDAQEYE